jgi:hypothetical protein
LRWVDISDALRKSAMLAERPTCCVCHDQFHPKHAAPIDRPAVDMRQRPHARRPSLPPQSGRLRPSVATRTSAQRGVAITPDNVVGDYRSA